MKANCLFYLNHLGGKAAEKTVQGLPNAVERIAKVLRAEEEESRLTRIPSRAGSSVFVVAPHTGANLRRGGVGGGKEHVWCDPNVRCRRLNNFITQQVRAEM